nr:hypothetical protein [uncultured Prevotella sp.]
MRKGGYYVNNTLLRASGRVNEWTSKQVNCEERQSNKGTSGQVNEWTGEQVDCEERQSNSGTGVSTYNIWGEKGLKKARD